MWPYTPAICIHCMRVAVAARDRLKVRHFLPEIQYVAWKVSSLVLVPGIAVSDRGSLVDDKVSVWKWWLWCVLLSRGSPFEVFVYSRNGMAGSISVFEDILDRIVEFI